MSFYTKAFLSWRPGHHDHFSIFYPRYPCFFFSIFHFPPIRDLPVKILTYRSLQFKASNDHLRQVPLSFTAWPAGFSPAGIRFVLHTSYLLLQRFMELSYFAGIKEALLRISTLFPLKADLSILHAIARPLFSFQEVLRWLLNLAVKIDTSSFRKNSTAVTKSQRAITTL